MVKRDLEAWVKETGIPEPLSVPVAIRMDQEKQAMLREDIFAKSR